MVDDENAIVTHAVLCTAIEANERLSLAVDVV